MKRQAAEALVRCVAAAHTGTHNASCPTTQELTGSQDVGPGKMETFVLETLSPGRRLRGTPELLQSVVMECSHAAGTAFRNSTAHINRSCVLQGPRPNLPCVAPQGLVVES